MDKSLTVTTHISPRILAAMHRYAVSKGVNHKTLSGLTRDFLELINDTLEIEPFTTVNEALEYLKAFGFDVKVSQALKSPTLLKALESETGEESEKARLAKKALLLLGD